MRIGIVTIWSVLLISGATGQGFTNWIVGDTTDIITLEHRSGVLLAGGGPDNDQAMAWLLNRADGGDVLVIRASGSDGYNNYLFGELGVNVNSVETIRFDNANASDDPYVIRRIREAEVLFIAGGDQFDYYTFWKDQPVEDAINFLINEKRVTVGGTSAGMAILGKAYYTPNAGSLTTVQALANPFHPNVDILGNDDFIDHPFLPDVVTDTHYDQRNRSGRHMVFLARLAHQTGRRSFGIACNEVTAVAIDETATAKVFGEWPDYEDYAYFLQSNCQTEFQAEILENDIPLTWNRGRSAVKAYKVPGTIDGDNTFDLNDWRSGVGGEWQNWFVEAGVLEQISQTNGDCSAVLTSHNEAKRHVEIKYYPNPFTDQLTIEGANKGNLIRITDTVGRVVHTEKFTGEQMTLDLSRLPPGNYMLSIDRKEFTVQKL